MTRSTRQIEKLRKLTERDNIRVSDTDRHIRELLYMLYIQEERIQSQIRMTKAEHTHMYVPRTPYDPDDKWFSSGAICIICGDTASGWYCHISPTKQCQYHPESHGESCIHCGQPEERK